MNGESSTLSNGMSDLMRDRSEYSQDLIHPTNNSHSLSEPLSLADQLNVSWINERCAPELLPFCTDIIEEVSEMIKYQQKNIAKFQDSKNVNAPQGGLKAILLQAEVERLRFVIRSYLRTRIDKIERYSFFYSKNLEFILPNLASHETAYLQSFHKLLSSALLKTSSEGLPPELSEIDASDNTMPQPSLEEGVFFRAKVYISDFKVASETIELNPGSIFFLAYELVKDLLSKNLIELI